MVKEMVDIVSALQLILAVVVLVIESVASVTAPFFSVLRNADSRIRNLIIPIKNDDEINCDF